MTDQRWKLVESIFQGALALKEGEQESYLAEACQGDDALYREVSSLLHHYHRQDPLLDNSHVPGLFTAGQIRTLTPGDSVGCYKIAGLLGRGGMGEVYRARDSKLNRDVALKVLPAAFANDAEQMIRFSREARVLASLNHAHIASIYGLEETGDVRALVLELVEGPTLADRIARGAIPMEEALTIARQIAEAIEYAHEKGITHRDLKPANIKVTTDGCVKVLDFGLAKVLQGDISNSDPSSSSTLTGLNTEPGMIVGTAPYMSPEQAKGKPVDKRTDIWAFGVVLYEMLTGRRLFQGETLSDNLAAVLREEPEWNRVPAKVQPLLRRCLEKDPKRRLRDIGDMELLLETAPIAVRTRRPWLAWGLAAACLILLTWIGFSQLRSARSPERNTVRLSLLPPQPTSFVPNNFTISPDGRQLAFVAAGQDGGNALWVRSLAANTAQELAGTEGAMYPFWSPDSRQIGFFGAGKLKTIDPSAGTSRIVCSVPAGSGGTWNNQGAIVFASNIFGPLLKVSASGGTPEPATKITASVGNQAHRWPMFLPDGNHFLYFVDWSTGPNSAPNGIYAGSLNSMDSKLISSEIIGNTQFASGRFYYVREGSLMAQPFDLERLQTTGPAEPIVPQELEQELAFSHAGFSVSDNGVVVFQSAGDSVARFSWVDRTGKELDKLPATGYRDPSLSSDATLVALSSDDEGTGKHYIRVYDFARGTSVRLSDGGVDVFPVLSPNSKTVVYGTSDSKGSYLATVAADGSDKPQRLLEGRNLIPNDWSRDGRYLVYMDFQNGLPEIQVYDFAIRSTKAYASGAEAQFSPDGKWLAFAQPGTQAGGFNLMVAPFPGPGGLIQVSNHGGAQVRWSGDGKEIFYISPDKKLMAVSIDSSKGKLVAGVPHALFQTRIVASRFVMFQYAVSGDGKRFLINSLPSVGATPLTVLMRNE
jgi:serine/threonine protein kinase/Tol biopolymer transport system component